MVKVVAFFWGLENPTFNRNPYNGYINPYYWVDDHPLLCGNNGSLDPGTKTLNFDLDVTFAQASSAVRLDTQLSKSRRCCCAKLQSVYSSKSLYFGRAILVKIVSIFPTGQ